MPLEGKQMMPRDIAVLCDEEGWHGRDLVKMVATVLSESNGYVGAYHDNVDGAGEVISRDCGLGQVNIMARLIGSEEEHSLRSDPAYNISRCRDLFDTPWGSSSGTRRFQPWAGFTSGWALFPEWYIWTTAEPHVWAPTGRYLHRALRGVANYYARDLGVDLRNGFNLDWVKAPKMPTAPPADGIGPRPVKNDGQ